MLHNPSNAVGAITSLSERSELKTAVGMLFRTTLDLEIPSGISSLADAKRLT